MSDTLKHCTNCVFFISADNEKAQGRAYGGTVHFDSCARTGKFLSPTAALVTNEGERLAHLSETAEGCAQYTEIEDHQTHRVPTHRARRDPLNFGLQAATESSIQDRVNDVVEGMRQGGDFVIVYSNEDQSGDARSCANCIFRMAPSVAQSTFGVTSAVCMARGGVLPDSSGSNRGTANECDSFSRTAQPRSLQNFRQRLVDPMVGEFVVPPSLMNFMDVNDRVGFIIKERIEASKPFEFVEPTTYKTDADVSDEDKADGIRAWRKLFSTSGERSVMIPIFDHEFFSEDELKKIPQSGDKEHPELYQDHANNAFKVATLWFKMDETPLLQGVPGTGKGHPVDTKVLTPQGWRRVGDLEVGDYVVGKNGKPTRVRGVFDRGVLPVNRVTMTDGSSVLVDDDHLWHVTTLDKRTYVKDTRTLRKESLFRTVKRGNGRTSPAYKFAIPQVEPVQFEGGDLPIHPYVLGVLLANGHLGSDPLYYTRDKYVSDKVGRLVDQKDRSVKSHPVPRFVVKGGTWKELIKLNLNGRLSAQKFIPEQYLFASEDDRRELLAGLMDCDGTVTQTGGNTQYCTTSQHLAEGVVELVQSLGGTASIQYLDYTKDGVLVERYEKTVNISMGNDCPFQTPLKAEKRGRSAHRAPVRKIKSIESAGAAEVRCISVEAADELYVTEDYIVTHNTEFYRYMSWLMQIPFERISITGSSELDDLAGKTLFENNETVFQKGRIPKAWEKPSVLCLDEPNVGPLEVWQFIRPLTDNSKQLVLDMADGETVSRHKYCRLGMAVNPSWDARNIGAQPLADADSNRLSHIFIDFPGEKIERNILTNRCKADGYEMPDTMLDKLMKIAKNLRDMSTSEDLPVTWGIRQQIKVARATEHFDLEDCYKMAVTDNLEPEIAEVILNAVRLVDRGNSYDQGGYVGNF